MNRRVLRLALLYREMVTLSGEAFENRIGDYLKAIYGEDFERIRAVGSYGDGGNDGFRKSTKTLYQCYGKHPDSPVSPPYIAEKITSNFQHARSSYPDGKMREWVFVHNLVEGLPNEANQALTNLIDVNPELTIAVHTFASL